MKSIDLQKGAVMFETAYVLPLVLAVILLIVEVLAFAMNSFAVNDVLYELRSDLVEDISAVSKDGLASGYASCLSGAVILDKALIETDVTADVIKRIRLLSTNSDLTMTGSTSVKLVQYAGFHGYMIAFSGAASTLVIPNFLAKIFPIKVDSIISVKENCTS